MGRWGRNGDLDFWTADARGEVDAAEARAVELLWRTTDPWRFGYYCQTGMLPAMGNVTGRLYMIERGGAALEVDDGRPVGSWCISIGPHRTDIPGTDHVVVLRNFVEGEELFFLAEGNRSPVFDWDALVVLATYRNAEWLPNLFFGPIDPGGDDGNEEILNLEELRPNNWMGVAGIAAPVNAYIPELPGPVERYIGRPQ